MKKPPILLLIFFCISITLLSCGYQQNELVHPLATTVVEGRVTLWSNFDSDHNHGFTRIGLINLNNTQAFFDFDSGVVTIDESADIYLNVGCGTNCFNDIVDANGAKSVEYGSIEPGFEGCLKKLQEDDLWASIVPGIYSCIYTNGGNIVQLLAIENEARIENAKFVFEYIIWYK